MKYLLSIFLVACSYTALWACSFGLVPFCETLTNDDSTLVVFGKIVGVDADGIDFDVIEVLRGSESRTRLRIWDGGDFDCNGPFSMAAADLGKVNDSLIVMLPKIATAVQPWDVVGDFTRPNPYGPQPSVRVSNGLALGYLAYAPIGSASVFSESAPFQEVRDLVVRGADCSALTTSVLSPPEGLAIDVVNPLATQLQVHLNQPIETGQLRLMSTTGQLVLEHQLDQATQLTLPIEHLPAGFYVLVIAGPSWQDTRRVVKQ